MMDPNIRSTPKHQLMLEISGSELVPIASTIKESILRKSFRQFEIAREIHIVTQYDDVELKLV